MSQAPVGSAAWRLSKAAVAARLRATRKVFGREVPCCRSALTRGFCLSVLLGWAALLPSAAGAQGQYPDKPIRLIVPQAPGSATDTVARILASELGPQLGQTVIIENKPGAAFTIGLDLVAKAPPDGYTLGLGPIGALSISPNMIAKIPYSIEKDFAPVALVARGHLLLAVAPTSEYKTVKDLIAASKKNPGKMTNASSASGSPGHVGAELFKYMAGVDAVHVPYRGGAAATTDLIAGRVTFMFESLNSIRRMPSPARCARSASAATAVRPRSPTCRRWRKRACRATARRPGAA